MHVGDEMKDKKGLEALWWIIISFVVVAVVAFIIIFSFTGIFKKEKGIVEGQLEGQCSGTCKADCAEDERLVLGLFKNCEQGQVCCVKRSS